MISEKPLGTILIVDDVLDNLRLLSHILTEHGYHVRSAKNGTEALVTVKNSLPDLILLDIKLPDLNGYEVCKKLKADDVSKEIPVIFLSVLDSTSDKLKGFQAGGVDYITKPFYPEEVLMRIQTHLNISRMQKQLEHQADWLRTSEQNYRNKNEELMKLNVEKDKFFSILAHDLRSPFNSFLGLTKMLVEGTPSLTQDKIQKIAESMRKSATNLYGLLENLLEWSSLQTGIKTFNPASVKLHERISETMASIREMASRKGIDINYNIPEDLVVYADENMLGSIIRNLSSNAVKFTHRGGNVIITVNPNSNGYVEISFRDTGVGMHREMVENLFKLDIDTSRKGTDNEPSTGLGIILCKEFVEKHGGKLWVESEEGKGSTFYFTLPAKASN